MTKTTPKRILIILGHPSNDSFCAGLAEQNVAVNTFPGLVHTARHTMGVGCTRSS